MASIDHEQTMNRYIREYQRARRVFLWQGFFLFACTLYIGMTTLDQSRIVGILMLIGAGVAICSCLARLTVLRVIHKSRMYTAELHDYYQRAVQNLYHVYGHNEMPKDRPVPPSELVP
jgi:hypothetical protein